MQRRSRGDDRGGGYRPNCRRLEPPFSYTASLRPNCMRAKELSRRVDRWDQRAVRGLRSRCRGRRAAWLPAMLSMTVRVALRRARPTPATDLSHPPSSASLPPLSTNNLLYPPSVTLKPCPKTRSQPHRRCASSLVSNRIPTASSTRSLTTEPRSRSWRAASPVSQSTIAGSQSGCQARRAVWEKGREKREDSS